MNINKYELFSSFVYNLAIILVLIIFCFYVLITVHIFCSHQLSGYTVTFFCYHNPIMNRNENLDFEMLHVVNLKAQQSHPRMMGLQRKLNVQMHNRYNSNYPLQENDFAYNYLRITSLDVNYIMFIYFVLKIYSYKILSN